MPNCCVVEISKFARTIETFAKRMRIQEKLKSQIATTISQFLQPKRVAVVIDAARGSIIKRGVHKTGIGMVCNTLLGCFDDDRDLRHDFMGQIRSPH